MKRRAGIREIGFGRAAAESDEERRRREFLQAVDSITEEDVKQHRRTEDDHAPGPAPLAADGIIDTVDLHGLTVDEATRRLAELVRRWRGTGRSVRVIVGKGYHSPTGVGVLREAVPAWLDSVGHRWVAEWRWARPKEGGAGVIIARLRHKTRK